MSSLVETCDAAVKNRSSLSILQRELSPKIKHYHKSHISFYCDSVLIVLLKADG